MEVGLTIIYNVFLNQHCIYKFGLHFHKQYAYYKYLSISYVQTCHGHAMHSFMALNVYKISKLDALSNSFPLMKYFKTNISKLVSKSKV